MKSIIHFLASLWPVKNVDYYVRGLENAATGLLRAEKKAESKASFLGAQINLLDEAKTKALEVAVRARRVAKKIADIIS